MKKLKVHEYVAAKCFSAHDPYNLNFHNRLVKSIRSKIVELDKAEDENQRLPNPQTLMNTINLIRGLNMNIASYLDVDDISIESNGSISVDIFMNNLIIYFSVGDASYNYIAKKQGRILSEAEGLTFQNPHFQLQIDDISNALLIESFSENFRNYYTRLSHSTAKLKSSTWFSCTEYNIVQD